MGFVGELGNFGIFVSSRPLNSLNSNSILRTTDLYSTRQTQPLGFGELETWEQSSLGLHSHGSPIYTGHVFPLNASP